MRCNREVRANHLAFMRRVVVEAANYQSVGPVAFRLHVLVGAVGVALAWNICIRQTRPMPSPLRSVLGIGNRDVSNCEQISHWSAWYCGSARKPLPSHQLSNINEERTYGEKE